MNFAPKTAAAGIGGAVGIVFVWMCGLILSVLHNHIDVIPSVMPNEVAASLASIFSTAASYYAPRSPHPPPPVDNEPTNEIQRQITTQWADPTTPL